MHKRTVYHTRHRAGDILVTHRQQLLRRELRCRHALALLAGGRSLADVAAASGFSDQSHLSRTLWLTTGSTPSRLRRRVKSVQDNITAVRA